MSAQHDGFNANVKEVLEHLKKAHDISRKLPADQWQRKLKALQQEVKQYGENRSYKRCITCGEEPELVCMPCGHLCLCSKCEYASKKGCPICGVNVESIIRVKYN